MFILSQVKDAINEVQIEKAIINNLMYSVRNKITLNKLRIKCEKLNKKERELFSCYDKCR